MPSKKVKKRNTWNLRKILITLFVSLAGVGLGSLMNTDRLATNSLYREISKLQIQLKNQKIQTQQANKEAQETRLDNTRAVMQVCISFVQKPETAPSESIT